MQLVVINRKKGDTLVDLMRVPNYEFAAAKLILNILATITVINRQENTLAQSAMPT